MAARTFVPTDYPLVDLETGKITAQWRRFQQDVSTALTPGAINTLLTSDGVGFVWSKLKNANVDVAAAIAYSKLNLATSIVNGDIAAAAAIDWTKISKVGSSIADLATRSAGDLNSGTLNAARLPTLSASFVLLNAGGTIAAGATVYVGPVGQSATEAIVLVPCPLAGVLRNLYVVTDGAAGAAQSFTYTVRKNAADTALTCAISGGAAVTANDVTHSVSIAAGDTLAVKVVATAGAAVVHHSIGFEVATA